MMVGLLICSFISLLLGIVIGVAFTMDTLEKNPRLVKKYFDTE